MLLTLTAWFFATGSQWDIAQTFGWARMFVAYTQTMPVLEALQKTLSGEELCGVCEVVQEARHDGQDQTDSHDAAGTKSLAKLPLVLPPATVTVTAQPAAALRPGPAAPARGKIGRAHV
mgnify:FL=1